MFELQPNEPADVGIRRILMEEVETAMALLLDTSNDRDKAVHNARKGLKRVRAGLRLIRDELGQDTYKAENVWYRDVARLLAPLRDSAVLVETLDDVRNHYSAELPPDAFADIRAQLVDRQLRIRRELLEETPTAEQAAARLATARDRIPDLPIAHSDFRAYAGGLRRVYKRGVRRMAKAYAGENPELYHDWRKRVKYLWHHLEILRPISPWLFAVMIEEAHHVSSLLGDAHDFVVLNETLLDPDEHFAVSAERAHLIALAEKRSHELEAQAKPFGTRIYAESPDSFVERVATYYDVWRETGVAGVAMPKPKKSTLPKLLTTAEVAQQLDLTVSAVRRRIHAGDIPAQKHGNVWLIQSDAIDATVS